jgi:hypothetical protein
MWVAGTLAVLATPPVHVPLITTWPELATAITTSGSTEFTLASDFNNSTFAMSKGSISISSSDVNFAVSTNGNGAVVDGRPCDPTDGYDDSTDTNPFFTVSGLGAGQTLESLTLRNNCGGAIAVTDGTAFKGKYLTFSGNERVAAGGAIYSTGGTIAVSQSKFILWET